VQERVGVGVVGCGTISAAYLRAARYFPILEVPALATSTGARPRRGRRKFGTRAGPVAEDLLADPANEIVLNLTTPRAHLEVSLAALREELTRPQIATVMRRGLLWAARR
jgi:predicted dehydrogenase